VIRVHCSCDIAKEDDLKALAKYVANLPLVKEVVVLHHDKAAISAALPLFLPNSVCSGFTLKGYQSTVGELDAWCPPYPYEGDNKQIVL
jgi:hypothetical protein